MLRTVIPLAIAIALTNGKISHSQPLNPQIGEKLRFSSGLEKHFFEHLPDYQTSQLAFLAHDSLTFRAMNTKFNALKARSAKRRIRTVLALKTLVHHIQKDHLRHYRTIATLGATLDSGIYNCLTAVTLVSVALDTNRLKYKVMTTQNHVFIIVNMPIGEVLIEATDKNNPIIDYPDGIAQAMSSYQATATAPPIEVANHQNKLGLAALFYLNSAVELAQAKRHAEALEQAIKYLLINTYGLSPSLPVLDFLIAQRQNENLGYQEILSIKTWFEPTNLSGN